MEKYLISIDLDGTIINGLYDLKDYTIKVFNELERLGHKIIIITGRPFRSSYFVYYKFHLNTPILNYNGQYITNPSDYTYKKYSNPMNRIEILDIYNKVKDDCYLFFSEAYDNIYSNIDKEDVRLLMHHNFLSNLYIGDLNEILDLDPHGTMILAKKNKSDSIIKYVEENHKNLGARLWKWGPYEEIVELYLKGFNKGTALKRVMDEMGFDKEHTISFIDSRNDSEIIDITGLSICPSNAEEVIKNKADITLNKSVDEEAVALYLNERFNLGIKKD